MAAKVLRKSDRLRMESLESRQTMNADLALAFALASLSNSGSTSDDRYEPNDSRSNAAEIGALQAPQTITGLKMADSQDWFEFRLPSTAGSDASVEISFQHRRGDLDLTVYNAAGTRIGSSTGTGDREQVSLAGQPAGDYFVKVFGYNGAHNSSYSLTVNPGRPPQAAPTSAANSAAAEGDDRFENNDSRGAAANWGTLSGRQSFTGLVLQDDDWYQFRTTSPGRSGDSVQVDFQHTRGDVDIQLYNSAGNSVASSTGVGNREQISLAGLPAGDYTLRVYGFQGARNPSYSVTVQAPTSASGGSASPGSTVVPANSTASTSPAGAGLNNLATAMLITQAQSQRSAGAVSLATPAPLAVVPTAAPQFYTSGGVTAQNLPTARGIDQLLQQSAAQVTSMPVSPLSSTDLMLIAANQQARDPRYDNGLGYMPVVPSAQLVDQVLRSDLAQHADWSAVQMYGGTRPGIYFDVQDNIRDNYAFGSTQVNLPAVNAAYGIGDANLNLLNQVSGGYFSSANPRGQVAIPLFQSQGWGSPIG